MASIDYDFLSIILGDSAGYFLTIEDFPGYFVEFHLGLFVINLLSIGILSVKNYTSFWYKLD